MKVKDFVAHINKNHAVIKFDKGSFKLVDGMLRYSFTVPHPIGFIPVKFLTATAQPTPAPTPVTPPAPRLFTAWWCSPCNKGLHSMYPSTNHYCPTCRSSCAPYTGQNLQAPPIYPHAQNVYTRTCSDPVCGATWSGTGYVPITCPTCHQMTNKLQFECKPCGIRYLEGAATANARHLNQATHQFECPQCGKDGVLAQVAVTAVLPGPASGVNVFGQPLQRGLPSGQVPLHDWGLIDQGEKTCKRCGVVENVMLRTSIPNCKYPLGYKLVPIAKCECDIRDLMTYGHKAGCPEKKR